MCGWEGLISSKKVLMACDSDQGVGLWLNTFLSRPGWRWEDWRNISDTKEAWSLKTPNHCDFGLHKWNCGCWNLSIQYRHLFLFHFKHWVCVWKTRRRHVCTFFFFFFLVQKALSQLHFVLIMKRGFVPIMTNSGSCLYQQTVLRYNSKLHNTASVLPSGETAAAYFTPIFILLLLLTVSNASWKLQSAHKLNIVPWCVTLSKLFPNFRKTSIPVLWWEASCGVSSKVNTFRLYVEVTPH